MVDTQQDENAPDDRQHDSNQHRLPSLFPKPQKTLLPKSRRPCLEKWLPWIHQGQLQCRRHPLTLIAMNKHMATILLGNRQPGKITCTHNDLN
jgi:hypothetical protein